MKIQQRLGNGAFGVAYKVKDEATSRVYALKDVLCLQDSAIRNAIREGETMKQISHENIIEVIGADQLRNAQGLHILIVTEYCPGGNLNKRLSRPSAEALNSKWFSHNLVPRVLSPPPSRKYPGFGWSRVSLKQTAPHQGGLAFLQEAKGKANAK